jgi:DnaK suppressor protein
MSPKAKASKKKAAPVKKARKAVGAASKAKAKSSSSGTKTTAKKTKKAAASSKVAGRRKSPTVNRAGSTAKAKKKVGKARKTRTARPRLPRLTPKQMRYYQDLLSTKQKELTAAYQTSKGDSRSDLDDGTEDYIDYAVHSYAREFLLSLTEMDRKQLFLVEEALERLKRRQFGYCQHCRETINAKRMAVAPWARYCISCQELDEKGLLDAWLDSADENEEESPASNLRSGHDEDDISEGFEDEEDDEDLVAGNDS